MGARAGWATMVVTLLMPIGSAAQAPPAPVPGQPPASADSAQAPMHGQMQDELHDMMQGMMARMQAMQEMMQGMQQMMHAMHGQHGGGMQGMDGMQGQAGAAQDAQGGHAHGGAPTASPGSDGPLAHQGMGCMHMAPQAPTTGPESPQAAPTAPAPDHNH
jgi:hypothetical protein